MLLNSPEMHDIVSGYANGTTVNMLPIVGVQKPQIVVPPSGLVRAFDSLSLSILDRREQSFLESETLVNLRDTLLPKLISGELRIKDAERFVEASV
jgi:type I restriction enzyme S subunit